MSLLELFCNLDNFWQAFTVDWYQRLLSTRTIKPVRATEMTTSEIMWHAR